MAIKRRLRRNSLKDFLETFYFGSTSRRLSKELKIQQQFLQKKTLHYRKNFSCINVNSNLIVNYCFFLWKNDQFVFFNLILLLL